jgi:hypothetical protein
MHGLGTTPLRPPPYVSQHVAADQAAPQANDPPVPPELSPRCCISTPHPRLRRELSPRAMGLHAQVPESLGQSGWRRALESIRTRCDESPRRGPKATHDAEDEFLPRCFGDQYEGACSARARAVHRGRCRSASTKDARQPCRSKPDSHHHPDQPEMTQVRVPGRLVDNSWIRRDPDPVPRGYVIRRNHVVEERTRSDGLRVRLAKCASAAGPYVCARKNQP